MSLLFPAYLLGALGLVLPWLLHRFSDQQPPLQLFPSKRFLEATTPPVSRKQTLRYRALLVLRVSSLLLLCALFAQPWINRNTALVAQEQHHMIAIDRSLSMRAEGIWPEVVGKAEDLIAQLDGGSVQLISFDKSVNLLAEAGQENPAEQVPLGEALDDLQPGYAAADYGFLMQRLDRLASDSELPVKVWLITDRQQSALPAQLNALYAPSVDEFELVPVDVGDLINVHLAARAESDDGATASVSVRLLASVTDTSAANESIERTVRIESSERTLEQRSVSLTPGELAVVSFDNLVLPAQSNPELLVSLLETDALADDDAQLLPILQSQPTGVVLLRQPGEPVDSASVFVTTALETNATASVEVIRGNASQVPLDTPNLVTGIDLTTQDPGMDVLQYVDTGNSALVFNQGSGDTSTANLFDGVGIGLIDEAHPLALGDIDWLGTRFFNLPELQLQPEDRVLLRTADGQSVLIERPVNRGRLLILNDPLDGLASNLPLQPSFVTLVQSLVRFFDASTSVPSEVVVGDRLALPANTQLIDGDGNGLLELADQGQSSTVELAEPGLYTVVSARAEQRLRAVLDIAEADMTRLDASSISAWQARYTDESGTGSTPANSGSAIRDRVETSIPGASDNPKQLTLWQWLLPLAALLLLAEGWFANRHLDVRRDGS